MYLKLSAASIKSLNLSCKRFEKGKWWIHHFVSWSLLLTLVGSDNLPEPDNELRLKWNTTAEYSSGDSVLKTLRQVPKNKLFCQRTAFPLFVQLRDSMLQSNKSNLSNKSNEIIDRKTGYTRAHQI